MRHSTKPITRMELEYMAQVRALPCVCCMKALISRQSILHHILWAGKRMGHRFVLPLCWAHHTGEFEPGQHYGANYSVHHHHRKFVETFGTEKELWEGVQSVLDLPVTGWPESKILRRAIV
jgi:Recombination enhancement, RecA-dependent nuclease